MINAGLFYLEFSEMPSRTTPIVAIILGILGGILLIFLILLCCLVILISYSQRQQQIKELKNNYLFDRMPTLPFSGLSGDSFTSEDAMSETSDSVISDETIRTISSTQSRGNSWEIARRIEDIDEDTRMRYLMEVIRNSPYINVSLNYCRLAIVGNLRQGLVYLMRLLNK